MLNERISLIIIYHMYTDENQKTRYLISLQWQNKPIKEIDEPSPLSPLEKQITKVVFRNYMGFNG